MTSLNPVNRPRIYCDLTTKRTERGFSLENERSIKELAGIGLTLESSLGLTFVFVDGNMSFAGIVIHDPALGFLAASEEPTEAQSRNAKRLKSNILSYIPIFLGIASLFFVLTLVLGAWGALASRGDPVIGKLIFNGCAIGAALGLLSIALAIVNSVRNKGRYREALAAISISFVALCIHLPIVVIAMLVKSTN